MHGARLLFAVSTFALSLIPLAGCANNAEPGRSAASVEAAPAPYPAAVHATFMRACTTAGLNALKATGKLPPDPENPYANSSLERYVSEKGIRPACECRWSWIVEKVDYRDFVRHDLAMRSGSTDVPDWMVDATIACT
jgi:hypothetical protein